MAAPKGHPSRSKTRRDCIIHIRVGDEVVSVFMVDSL